MGKNTPIIGIAHPAHIHQFYSRTECRSPEHLKPLSDYLYIERFDTYVSINLDFGDHCHSVAYSNSFMQSHVFNSQLRNKTEIYFPVKFSDKNENQRIFCPFRYDLSKKHIHSMINCIISGGPIYRKQNDFYHFLKLNTGQYYQVVFTLTVNALERSTFDFEVKSAYLIEEFEIDRIWKTSCQQKLCDAIAQQMAGFTTVCQRNAA